MAGSLNRVTLLGRLGRDPEVRNTQSGDKVVNFSVAVSEQWKDKTTGEKREQTEWARIVIWGDQLGSVAERFLHKGSQVYLEGKMQTRKFVDKSGNERETTEVVLRGFDAKLVLIDPPPNTGQGAGQGAGAEGGRSGGWDNTGRSGNGAANGQASAGGGGAWGTGAGGGGGGRGRPLEDDDIPFAAPTE
jgi:single-strand DNA-binding protein